MTLYREYCILLWDPQFKRDVEKLDRLCWRPAKIARGFWRVTLEAGLLCSGEEAVEGQAKSWLQLLYREFKRLWS